MFLKELAAWGNVTRACRRAKVDRGGVYVARKNDPQLAAEWDETIEVFGDSMKEELVRRARDGIVSSQYYKGALIPDSKRLRTYSDGLLLAWLKAHDPKYRDKVQVDFEITADIAKQMTNDEINRFLAGKLSKPELVIILAQRRTDSPRA